MSGENGHLHSCTLSRLELQERQGYVSLGQHGMNCKGCLLKLLAQAKCLEGEMKKQFL